jgi:ParB/RepB/Spo0J family partition protein
MASRKPPPSPSPEPLVVEEIRLADIDASDDTFRQRAIIAVDDLVAELRQTPQQVPVFLRRRSDKRFQIVAGFRRVHALKELGRVRAKAIVLRCDAAEAWRLAWGENIAHRKLRGLDLRYLVFKLHDEGHNADEIARLCSMSERDARRIDAVGRLPDVVRALVREHDFSLRHAAVIASFLARHPRIDVAPTLASAAKRGLGEAHLAEELEALPKRRLGRPTLGVRIRDPHRLSIDTRLAQPEAWPEAVQKRLRALASWLEDALGRAAARGPSRRKRPGK